MLKTISIVFIFLLLSTSNVNASPIAAEALRAHNQVRAQDKQKPLIWNKDLAQISQEWATQLASTCKMYHHQGKVPFGENLYYHSKSTSVANAVKFWASEKSFTITNKIAAKLVNNVGTILKFYGKALQT